MTRYFCILEQLSRQVVLKPRTGSGCGSDLSGTELVELATIGASAFVPTNAVHTSPLTSLPDAFAFDAVEPVERGATMPKTVREQRVVSDPCQRAATLPNFKLLNSSCSF